jgi:hypothetical protein
MWKFCFLLMLVVASPVQAQPEKTRLQCDGRYSDFLSGHTDIADTGGYVEVQKSKVKVVSVVGFDGNYAVNSVNESRICFVKPEDKRIQGCLNRFTGELSLHQSMNSQKFDQLWRGKCSPARPLF